MSSELIFRLQLILMWPEKRHFGHVGIIKEHILLMNALAATLS